MNAVINLLESGQLSQQAPRSLAAASAPAPAASKAAADAAVAMDYVCRLLAAGRVTVQPLFVLQLLRHLVHQAADQGSHAAAAREATFVRIVQVVGVNTPGAPTDQHKLSAQVRCGCRHVWVHFIAPVYASYR